MATKATTKDTPDPAKDTVDPGVNLGDAAKDQKDTIRPVTFTYHLTDGTQVSRQAPDAMSARYAEDPETVRKKLGDLMKGWVFVPEAADRPHTGDLINSDNVLRVSIDY